MTGTLTVRENFHFSAALRLPSHMTSTERKTRVEKVLTELNLGGCADRKVLHNVDWGGGGGGGGGLEFPMSLSELANII